MEYDILLYTGNSIYNITERTETEWSVIWAEEHKGSGSFRIRTQKGDVIPAPGNIVEVQRGGIRIFYGLIEKVSSKRNMSGGSTYTLTTGTPESMLSNRRPALALKSMTVSDIVKHLYNSCIKYETGHPEDSSYAFCDIDPDLNFTYKSFNNNNNTLYEILDYLCEQHDCYWNVKLDAGGLARFQFKKTAGSSSVFHIGENTPGISQVSTKGTKDYFNTFRLDDGIISDDSSYRTREKTWYAKTKEEDDDPANWWTNIEFPLTQDGKLFYEVKEVRVSSRFDRIKEDPVLPEHMTYIYVFDQPDSTSLLTNHTLRELQDADDSFNEENLFAYLKGGLVTSVYYRGEYDLGLYINPNFKAVCRESAHGSPRVTLEYKDLFSMKTRSPDDYDTTKDPEYKLYSTTFLVTYKLGHRYLKTKVFPNLISEISEGKYTGIIDRYEKADREFASDDEGDSYLKSEMDYYKDPKEDLTIDTDQSFPYSLGLNDRADVRFPHLDIDYRNLTVTNIRIQPKLVRYDEDCQDIVITTYQMSSKAPELPKSLEPENEYNKEVRPYRPAGKAEIADMEESWTVHTEPKLFDMYVAEYSTTDLNNGQLAVPLDHEF